MWVFKLIYIASILLTYGVMYWATVLDAKKDDHSALEEFKEMPVVWAIGMALLAFVPIANLVVIVIGLEHCFTKIELDFSKFSIGDFINFINRNK